MRIRLFDSLIKKYFVIQKKGLPLQQQLKTNTMQELTLNNATPNQTEALMAIFKQLNQARKFGAWYGDDINNWELQWGYNNQSGNVYCAISNGVTIATPDFRPSDITYYVYCEENGELEFNTYQEAYEYEAANKAINA